MPQDNEFLISDNEFLNVQLLNCIMGKTGVGIAEAQRTVRYNIITPKQLSMITGRSVSAIQNLMRPKLSEEGDPTLKQVFPFALKDQKGPSFILFNKSCYDYIITTCTSTTKNNGKSAGRINEISEGT